MESYSLFAKKDFSDVFDKYDIGTLAVGVGISYENIEAQMQARPVQPLELIPILLNYCCTEHKYPVALGEKVYLASLLEYGFNQGGADITEWMSKTFNFSMTLRKILPLVSGIN